MRKHLLALLSICALAAPALAQPAPGGEFLVNTATPNVQHHARVARQFGPPGPGFIVVWEDGGGVITDITAAAFNVLGIKQVTDFRVNTYVTGFQTYPSVAGQYDGTFTVAWESKGQNEGSYGIYAQRSSSTGTPVGSEFLVSSYTTGSQRHPAMALSSTGTRVVFEGAGAGDPDGIFLSADPFATQSLVNVNTAALQKSASVSSGIALLGGAPDYVVVWSGTALAGAGINGHVFDSSGASYGTDFRVNATTSGDQTQPAVAANFFALGYVAVWESANGTGTLKDVMGQRLNADGSKRGPEFRVNTYTTGSQDQPQVAVDDHGNFVVVWSSYQDDHLRSVHARAYAADGVPLGAEYRLNDFTTGLQRMPSVAAMGGEGKFVAVWQSMGQEGPGSTEGVYARLFTVPPAVFANGDVNADGFVNVGDVFYLISFLFAGGPAPVGPGNVNGTGGVDVADVFYLINHLFAGGPAPV